jgi:hypothetical protein
MIWILVVVVFASISILFLRAFRLAAEFDAAVEQALSEEKYHASLRG